MKKYYGLWALDTRTCQDDDDDLISNDETLNSNLPEFDKVDPVEFYNLLRKKFHLPEFDYHWYQSELRQKGY